MLEDYEGDTENLIFRGIQLQDLNNDTSSHFQNKTCLKEHDVPTDFGYSVRVYTSSLNTKGNIPLVTFHDIGTNHNSFLGLFNYPHMQVLMQHFCVYHVCAPGHHDMASSLINKNQNTTPDGSGGLIGASSQDAYVYTIDTGEANNIEIFPSLDEMAEILQNVLNHFNIDCFLAVGMGAGSNVWTRFSLQNPKAKIHGMILLNPDDTTNAYYEWGHLKWTDLPQLRSNVSSDYLLNFLERHWFGYNVCTHPDISEMYIQHLEEMNKSNVAGYINSYIDRTYLNLERILGRSKKSQAHTVSCDTFLVTGGSAVDKMRLLAEMNSRMDPEKTQFVVVQDESGMIMEEAPEKLAILFLNFMRTIGLLISMTPEKLNVLTKEFIDQQHSNEDNVPVLEINEDRMLYNSNRPTSEALC